MPEDCVLEADSSDASPPHQVLNISNFIEFGYTIYHVGQTQQLGE